MLNLVLYIYILPQWKSQCIQMNRCFKIHLISEGYLDRFFLFLPPLYHYEQHYSEHLCTLLCLTYSIISLE